MLIYLEKALSQKDTRMILKITKGIRRYKKQIKSHHLKKIWEVFYPQRASIKFESYADYKGDYAENLELNKNQLNKLAKWPEIDI